MILKFSKENNYYNNKNTPFLNFIGKKGEFDKYIYIFIYVFMIDEENNVIFRKFHNKKEKKINKKYIQFVQIIKNNS